jgi:hypothetical protein
MGNLIGRIYWTVVETQSEASEAGNALLRLEDASIEPREITARDELRLQKLGELERANPSMGQGTGVQDPERHAKIMDLIREVQEDPREGLDQVVRVCYSKAVPLNEAFFLGYSENMRDSNVGFGLTGNKVSSGFFSWEWFNVEGNDEARKLQESGLLHFEKSTTPCGEEIIYMRFESDVSLRTYRTRNNIQHGAPI